MGLLGGALTLQLAQYDLTHTHALGGNLYVLIVLDVLKGLLKREYYGRCDVGLFIGTAGTHVGKLLALGNVDDQILLVNVLTYHLTGINLILRVHKELAAVLQFVKCVSKYSTGLHGNHRTVGTALNVTLVRLLLLEAVCHHSLTLRCGKNVCTEADDTA